MSLLQCVVVAVTVTAFGQSVPMEPYPRFRFLGYFYRGDASLIAVGVVFVHGFLRSWVMLFGCADASARTIVPASYASSPAETIAVATSLIFQLDFLEILFSRSCALGETSISARCFCFIDDGWNHGINVIATINLFFVDDPPDPP